MIEKFDIPVDFNDELEYEYVNLDKSLRDLEATVNQRIVEAALDDPSTVGGDANEPIEDEPPIAVLEAFRGDDESDVGERARLERRLQQVGIDIDELERSFVSYKTVQKHLNECLDIDTSRQETITTDSGEATIRWAIARAEGVIARTIERLDRVDLVAVGDFSVDTTVRITCKDCGKEMTVSEFISSGGCDCS